MFCLKPRNLASPMNRGAKDVPVQPGQYESGTVSFVVSEMSISAYLGSIRQLPAPNPFEVSEILLDPEVEMS